MATKTGRCTERRAAYDVSADPAPGRGARATTAHGPDPHSGQHAPAATGIASSAPPAAACARSPTSSNSQRQGARG